MVTVLAPIGIVACCDDRRGANREFAIVHCDAFGVFGFVIRIERPYLTTILAKATTLDCLESTCRHNIHTKSLPDWILSHFARVLAIFQLEFRALCDFSIVSDFNGETLRGILVPMELTICMIHRELLVVRVIIGSASVELEDTRIGIRVLDRNT